jgi:hypothetical protein
VGGNKELIPDLNSLESQGWGIAGQIPSIPTSKTAFYLAVLHKQT